MYITCEQCSTIFRLDETLLKLTGSKVRCSQCRHIFVAKPPMPDEAVQETAVADPGVVSAVADQPPSQQNAFDQELKGVDLAELDSILEKDKPDGDAEFQVDSIDDIEPEALVEFDEADLDMDFETALETDTDPVDAAGVEDQAVGLMSEPIDGQADEDLDLDMEFELDDALETPVESPVLESGLLEEDLDLDMEFELDEEGVEEIDALIPEVEASGDVEEIGEDIDSALDGFEGVLGQSDGLEEELPLEDDLEAVAAEPETGLAAADEPKSEASDEIDLGGLDSLLDEDEEEVESIDDIVDEDLELSLDDSISLDVDQDAEITATETATVETEGDDLDLAGGLDALLDDDSPEDERVEPEDTELSLSDDYDLDMEPETGTDVEEPRLAAVTEIEEEDGLDLTGLDDLLDDDVNEDASAASGQELSVDDDLKLTLDEETVGGDESLALDDDMGLSLDDDLGLEPDAVEEDGGDLSDMEELELSIIDDAVDEPATASLAAEEKDPTPPTGEVDPDEFDLSDFEGLLAQGESDQGVEEDVSQGAIPDLDLAADGDTAGEGNDDFEIEDLDSMLDEDEPVEQAEEAVSELSLDDDFELSLDDEPDLEMDTAATPEVGADDGADEDFDLSSIESDFLDEEDGDDQDAPVEDMELSLDDDLELSLDDEPDLEKDTAATPQVGADEGSDEDFDLSSIESDFLDEEDGDDQDAPVEDMELSLDDDLELSLDDESSAETDTAALAQVGDAQEEEEEDFDLSSIETDILDEEDGDEKDAPVEDLELSLDDDLALSLDDEPEIKTDAGAEGGDDLGDIEDLDFELDAEFEDKPISKTEESLEPEEAVKEEQSDEELDLTDIEKMLEDDSIVPEVDEAEDGLVSAVAGGGAEKWADEGDDSLGLGDDDEIDLAEIEEAIDSAEDDLSEESFADGVEDLELELDMGPEDATEGADEPEEEPELQLELEDDGQKAPADSPEEDDELDLSGFDLAADDEQAAGETETIDAGDIQLEFQVEDAEAADLDFDNAETIAADKTTSTGVETTGFMTGSETFSEDDTITTELIKDERKETPAKPVVRKKGAGKSLILVLVLALLGAGGYFGYDYLTKNNIQIPFLSDYLNPEAKDPSGIMQLATTDINSKFIENEATGRLFVVTGKVRSGYTIPRKLIRLQGKLYTKGKVLAKTEYAFAGLVMADQELSSKTLAEIKKRLNATAGQDSAITVGPGKSLPFMVVFSELPPDLDEFVIELVSSTKAQ